VKDLRKYKLFCKMILLLYIISFLFSYMSSSAVALPGEPVREKFGVSRSSKQDESAAALTLKKGYHDVKMEYESKGYEPAQVTDIVLDYQAVTASSRNDYTLKSGVGNSSKRALVWEETDEWFEWTADVNVPGLYEIIVEYYCIPGSSSPVKRELVIDGEVPFDEAHSITLNRMWNDGAETRHNNIGDEVQPRQIEIYRWQTVSLSDSKGMYSSPFRIYFSSGRHTIRFNYIDQPVAISCIVLKSPERLPGYAEVKKLYEAKCRYSGTTIKLQAENSVLYKSEPTLRRASDSDPMTEPVSMESKKLNFMGGWRWRLGNQSITWKIDVPEDGLYKIGFRYLQSYNDGLPVFRQIAIDGKIPFAEMEEYAFWFGENWQTDVFHSESGEPYLFYLSRGEHELTMTVKMGPLYRLVHSLTESSYALSDIIHRIAMITGADPDPLYNYYLEKRIPGIVENLKKIALRLQGDIDMLDGISTRRTVWARNFTAIKEQLEKMIADPDIISNKTAQIENAQNTLGDVILSLQDQPLGIDYLLVGSEEEKWVNKKSNIFQKIYLTLYNFVRSFKVDYDSIGNTYDKDDGNVKVINVWVSRGKEWGEIIKEMADTQFTPETNIAVNMNILPSSQLNIGAFNVLMLALSSGNAPDVALGISAASPVEFAIRDAVLNLEEFDDYEEIDSGFLPGMIIPLKYRGGVYALPETMDFRVLFYRKDIIGELGVKLPETWEDLYKLVLPALYQNNMEFYYPVNPVDISPFLFQRGGSFYNEDNTRSGLDTPEAVQAFKELTELYTNYGVPVKADFFSRMRTGQMPMGIAGFGTYMQLSTSAPELYGRWAIAPLPGTRKEDGTIDRTTAGTSAEAAMILSRTAYSREAWEFLKWWTSSGTQEQFGKELEALIGVEARWNTSNIEAFKNIPWKKDDLETIIGQWPEYKEMPVTPGGYFTVRHITNAWIRSVIGGMLVRDSLEQAVKDINKELRSKHEEYGIIIDEEDNR